MTILVAHDKNQALLLEMLATYGHQQAQLGEISAVTIVAASNLTNTFMDVLLFNTTKAEAVAQLTAIQNHFTTQEYLPQHGACECSEVVEVEILGGEAKWISHLAAFNQKVNELVNAGYVYTVVQVVATSHNEVDDLQVYRGGVEVESISPIIDSAIQLLRW